MDKRKTLTVELVAESPIGSDYFYTTLELPANPAEIEDAMQKARFSNSPTQYREIHVAIFLYIRYSASVDLIRQV